MVHGLEITAERFDHPEARALVAALEAAAARLGYRHLVLETGIRQADAMALDESAGWTPIPTDGAYRASAWSRCYEKSLGCSP